MGLVLSDIVLAGSFAAVTAVCLIGIRALAAVASGKPSRRRGREPAENG